MRAGHHTREVTFLTYHYWQSDRRAGFHGLAQAFLEAGWIVRFVTTGLSRISYLKTDPRLASLSGAPLNRWTTAPDGVRTYVYRPPVHPFARSPFIDPLTDRLFARLYKGLLPRDLGRGIASSDLVIFESSAALLLFDAVGRLAPQARRVYRVSDDVRQVGSPPSVLAAEGAALPRFDLVSVPSRVLLEARFGQIAAARFHPHGVDLTRLQAARDTAPPELARPACVGLGTTLFNTDLLTLCARARPDMTFYIAGALPKERRIQLPNIVWCGERPFAEALAMAAACDVAAAFYRPEAGTEYLAETSNKIAQYTFFRKPIIGPRHLAEPLAGRSFFAVDPETEAGARAALEAAEACAPPEPQTGLLRPWDVVRDEILLDAGLPPDGAEGSAAAKNCS